MSQPASRAGAGTGLRQFLLLLLVLLLGCRSAAQDERLVRVVAAASLRDALTEMAAAFERESPGVRVQLSFVASGAAVQQITEGAPFDLFFSADERYAQEVENRGKAVAGTRRVYARGRLVLWVPTRLGLEPTWPAALEDTRIRHVAMANPETAPYGRAAKQALDKAGVLDRIKDKLVFGQDVSQTAELALASADAAFIPRANAVGPTLSAQGRHVEVPAELYDPLLQSCVLLTAKPEARALYDYALGEEGRRILAAHGFDLP